MVCSPHAIAALKPTARRCSRHTRRSSTGATHAPPSCSTRKAISYRFTATARLHSDLAFPAVSSSPTTAILSPSCSSSAASCTEYARDGSPGITIEEAVQGARPWHLSIRWDFPPTRTPRSRRDERSFGGSPLRLPGARPSGRAHRPRQARRPVGRDAPPEVPGHAASLDPHARLGADDPHRARDQRGVHLQPGGHLRLPRDGPLVGAGNPRHDHGSRPLDRDALDHAGAGGAQGAREAAARHGAADLR